MIIEWLTAPVLETETIPGTGFVNFHRHWGVLVVLSACADVKAWHRVWRAGPVIS